MTIPPPIKDLTDFKRVGRGSEQETRRAGLPHTHTQTKKEKKEGIKPKLGNECKKKKKRKRGSMGETVPLVKRDRYLSKQSAAAVDD